ncbi:TPA: hypothetical protein DCR49_12420 [Candidatus Delongbacteria bacterium]|nr:MAG: hypothetical protein A2Y39_06205 [Candidatus Delongbacteria bacterium GWF2_40_14]HAQ62772.1 hypothetical protein [Candidatus Delongbacteria bacterium]
MDRCLKNDAYLVLLIPEPFSDQIYNLRMKYDPFLAKLPAEITVLGSSGTGQIKSGQNIQKIIEAVDDKITKIKAFEFNFKKMSKFPGSKIFYLEPEQRDSFDNIHTLLKSTSIEVKPIPYPYNPHCSIHSTSDLDSENKEILIEMICKDKIKIDKLALIEFDFPPFELNILKVWELTC